MLSNNATFAAEHISESVGRDDIRVVKSDLATSCVSKEVDYAVSVANRAPASNPTFTRKGFTNRLLQEVIYELQMLSVQILPVVLKGP